MCCHCDDRFQNMMRPRPSAGRAGSLLLLCLLCILTPGASSASGSPSSTPSLTERLHAGPMAGIDEFIFAARKMNDTDGHWYANIGYYAHDPNRKAWREGAS